MFGRFIRFITNRWVLACIGLLALAFLVWFAGPLIAVADYKPLSSVWARIGVIIALPVIWLLTQFRVRFTDKRAEAQLTEALDKDAEQPLATGAKAAAAPDPEQAILAERLKGALQTLQGADALKGRKLYQLPWYVIIGAPGSGKTTALKNSGLHFPLQSQLGDDPVQGAGGTRYCDWWFTDEAVFIDTAGRYTTQDNPREAANHAWLGFLGMLKRTRPKRPLNGILVTISILDLLTKTPTQQAMQATAIKRRIQELNEHLGMDLPVYVVFTKCDLIAGFNEFFLDLEAEERDQVWGVTLPFKAPDAAGEALAAFPARFEALIGRAADRIAHRLREERSPRRRMLIYEFPRQMLGLQSKLTNFLRDVFVPNQFEQPAILRGTYFVSATQTASPATWVSGVLPPTLCAPPVSSASSVTPRTFFIRRLLNDVVFAESGIAAANRREQRRFRWAYSGAMTAACAVFAISALAWLTGYGANRSFLDAVAAQIETYRDHQHALGGDSQPHWGEMVAALDRLQALPTGYGDGADLKPAAWGFGLDQGDKMGAQSRNAYLAVLERRFMPAIADQLLQQFENAGDREDYLYEALRIYLMFYQRDHMDAEAVKTWLGILWERALPGAHNEPVRLALGRHLAIALDEDLLLPPIDEQRVAAAREVLLATPLDRRLYVRLKSDYVAEHPEGFNVVDWLGRRNAEALFVRRSGRPLQEGVPSYFTYQGFHRGYSLQKRKLSTILAQEHWVYDDRGSAALSGEELDALSDALDEHYFREYVSAWRSYLEDLRLRRFDSSGSGRDLAQVLAAGDAPLVRLLKGVRRHTALTELPEGTASAAQVADQLSETAMPNQRRRLERLVPDGAMAGRLALPGQEVDDAFQDLNRFVASDDGAALDRLQAALRQLSEHLDQLAGSRDQRQQAFSAALDPQRNAPALRELDHSLAAAPAWVRQWLEPLTGDTRRITAAGARRYVNDVWQAEVISFYERAIAGRYPLDPAATREVRIEDFTLFFGPEGILDEFFQRHIEPFVDTRRPVWRWRRSIGISDRNLRVFQAAQRIRDAYFVGPGQPQVDFALRPHSLDSAVVQALLETGGAQVSYQHGPVRTTPLQWKLDSSTRSRLVLSLASRDTPLSTTEEGQWSLFRLIEKHATQQPLGEADGVLLSFVIDGIAAEYVLQPLRAANPFTHNDLRGFVLPKSL